MEKNVILVSKITQQNKKASFSHKKNYEKDSASQTYEMGIQRLEKGIFIGDSAATSHMTNDPTGIYNLQNIKCTHKGLLDLISIQSNGSTARDTWEIKFLSQFNHDLFSFLSAMKEGWQMNGRWNKHGIEIESLKKGHQSFFFNRMIPSGSSWLLGVKVKRVLGQAHAVIEPGEGSQ